MQTILRIILATTAVALVHSALASRSAKAAAARLVGSRNRNAFYRPFYIAQSAVSFGGLLLYIKQLPDRILWRAGTRFTLAANSMRLTALAGMVFAVKQIGFRRLVGLPGIKDWCAGRTTVAKEPEAQGPALDRGQRASGPFRFSRHPLNFLALPLIWLAPRMTRNWFVFNLLASAYFVLGSWHEEHRLRIAYGEKYERYRSETAFLLGRKKLRETGATRVLLTSRTPQCIRKDTCRYPST